MQKVINQEKMRSLNKRHILEYIQKNGPVAKAELAAKLGFSITSVSSVINELLREARIVGCGAAKSTGGRRSALYKVNPEACYFIGLDLQIDRIIGLVLDYSGTVVTDMEVPLPGKDEWQAAAAIKQICSALLKEHGLNQTKLRGVGIGIPGIVDTAAGLIEFAPNLGWKNVKLGRLLNLKVPVFLENEANAAAWGEKSSGIARDCSDLVYVSVGLGIGCGLLLNGVLYPGRAFHAGEFGHMTVEPAGIPCSCGNRGCWEVYASNAATLKRYAQNSGKTLSDFEAFLDAARSGDPLACAALAETVKYLGIGIANIVNGINPEMVVIGGRITAARELILEPLLREIKERSLDKSFSGLTLAFSPLHARATALGMAHMMLDQLAGETEEFSGSTGWIG